LKPKISPDFSDSVESETIQQTFLTCEVPFKSRNFSEIEHQLHYVWYKDEIPISVDNRILELSSYPEPVKQLSSSSSRQGTYSCVVTVEGIADRFSSQFVNYYLSDVATYTVFLQGVDVSVGYFVSLMKPMNKLISDVKEDFPWLFRGFEWDIQMSWKTEENMSVQLLLYFKTRFWYETQLYFVLKRKFKEEVLTITKSTSVSLELESADVCFEQALPSSSTSYNVTFLWKSTKQTKSAVSEPMCLNGIY
ncbi:hypothetical protein AVEN_173799-1, partial [Araneus ventricosus]